MARIDIEDDDMVFDLPTQKIIKLVCARQGEVSAQLKDLLVTIEQYVKSLEFKIQLLESKYETLYQFVMDRDSFPRIH